MWCAVSSFAGSMEELDRLGLQKWLSSEEFSAIHTPFLQDWAKKMWTLWTAYNDMGPGRNFYNMVPEAVLSSGCFKEWEMDS